MKNKKNITLSEYNAAMATIASYREQQRKKVSKPEYYGFLYWLNGDYYDKKGEKYRIKNIKAKSIEEACAKFVKGRSKHLERVDSDVSNLNTYIDIRHIKCIANWVK